MARIQADVDRLIWSREPDVDSAKRFRRFIAKDTAVGPINKGGANAIAWAEHIDAFHVDWMLRYLHPADSSWKRALDQMLLLDRKGEEKFSEGRGILMAKLKNTEKVRLLRTLPRGSRYMRKCIHALWSLKSRQDTETMNYAVGGETLWHNWRFDIEIDWRDRQYLERIVQVKKISDVIDSSTGEPFTKYRWREWIDESHDEAYGAMPEVRRRNKMANVAMSVVDQIPEDVKDVASVHERYDPKRGELVAMIREADLEVQYGYWIRVIDGKNEYEKALIDAVALAHHTGTMIKTQTRQPYKVAYWKDRVVGPKNSTFPLSGGWKVGGEKVTLGNLKISETTRLLKQRKFRFPAAEMAWLRRFGYNINITKIWQARAYMLTPRDKLQFWKVRHRTLYTRKHDKDTDGKCAACSEMENIEHLVDCTIIRLEFWDRILELLDLFSFPPPADTRAFLLLGMQSPDKMRTRKPSGCSH